MRGIRNFMLLLASAALYSGFAGTVMAQTYPTKVIRYIIPDSAGSGGDVMGRLVAAGLSEIFGVQVVVDNRPGAGGQIGGEIVARAPADGYTLLHMSSTLTANVNLYKHLPFDLVKDFAPLTLLALATNVAVVNPTLPAKSISELVSLAKARPGTINFATAGTGSRSFTDAVLLARLTGIDIVHVPYKGGGEALNSVISGETPLMFPPVATALPHIRSGRVRALGVTTAKRLPLIADVPTIAEAGGPGYVSSNWFGLMAPAKTPPAVLATIHRAVVAALKKPETVKRISDIGCVPVGNTPEEFAAFVKADIAMLADIFKSVGIAPN